jgi:hypothetical protein
MKILKHYMKIYWLLFALNIKARMEYRADFVISLVGILFLNVLGALALWIIFHPEPCRLELPRADIHLRIRSGVRGSGPGAFR